MAIIWSVVEDGLQYEKFIISARRNIVSEDIRDIPVVFSVRALRLLEFFASFSVHLTHRVLRTVCDFSLTSRVGGPMNSRIPEIYLRCITKTPNLSSFQNAKQGYTGLFCQFTVHLTKLGHIEGTPKPRGGLPILSRYTSFWQKCNVLIFEMRKTVYH